MAEKKVTKNNKKITSSRKQVTRVESQESSKEAVKTETKAAPSKKPGGLSIPVYSLVGKESGTLDLPKEVFGEKVNKALLAQALRVYLNNQKGHFSNTKTRGEVEGSTRKIYAQKGTGRARHGGIRAPIFVGGGIALGPKSRKVFLDLPQKMKRASLISALSQKAFDGKILGLTGLDKASGKTKEIAKFVKTVLSLPKDKKMDALIIGDEGMEAVQRAVRNIRGLDFLRAEYINAFEVIKHQSLILTKEAVEKLASKVKGEGSSKEVLKSEKALRVTKVTREAKK